MKFKASPGFSLLEVMVALAITGLCLGLVTISFGSVYRAHNRAREHMELQQTLNESMERIRFLLQSAYLADRYPNQFLTIFETMDDDNLSDPYDAITFTTLAHTTHKINAKEAELIEVTLFTKDEPAMETPENKRLRLRKLRVRAGGEINTRFEVENGTVYTLADHVTRFHLEYLSDLGEWKPEWIPEDNDKYSLPCAIKVTLGVRTETIEEIQASMLVPMEMARLDCGFDDERIFEE
jgi:prepilin-type N-terminal cleavage/methylation domain-containing protein